MTLRTTKSEDEEKSTVVHCTTQPGECQPLEIRTQHLLPISYLMLLQTVLIVYLVRQSFLHGLVLLAKSSLSRLLYPQSGLIYSVSKGTRLECVCSLSFSLALLFSLSLSLALSLSLSL